MSRQSPQKGKMPPSGGRGRKRAQEGRKRAQEKEANKPSQKKYATKQPLGNQLANALVKPELIQLIGENHADELNNTRKE